MVVLPQEGRMKIQFVKVVFLLIFIPTIIGKPQPDSLIGPDLEKHHGCHDHDHTHQEADSDEEHEEGRLKRNVYYGQEDRRHLSLVGHMDDPKPIKNYRYTKIDPRYSPPKTKQNYKGIINYAQQTKRTTASSKNSTTQKKTTPVTTAAPVTLLTLNRSRDLDPVKIKQKGVTASKPKRSIVKREAEVTELKAEEMVSESGKGNKNLDISAQVQESNKTSEENVSSRITGSDKKTEEANVNNEAEAKDISFRISEKDQKQVKSADAEKTSDSLVTKISINKPSDRKDISAKSQLKDIKKKPDEKIKSKTQELGAKPEDEVAPRISHESHDDTVAEKITEDKDDRKTTPEEKAPVTNTQEQKINIKETTQVNAAESPEDTPVDRIQHDIKETKEDKESTVKGNANLFTQTEAKASEKTEKLTDAQLAPQGKVSEEVEKTVISENVTNIPDVSKSAETLKTEIKDSESHPNAEETKQSPTQVSTVETAALPTEENTQKEEKNIGEIEDVAPRMETDVKETLKNKEETLVSGVNDEKAVQNKEVLKPESPHLKTDEGVNIKNENIQIRMQLDKEPRNKAEGNAKDENIQIRIEANLESANEGSSEVSARIQNGAKVVEKANPEQETKDNDSETVLNRELEATEVASELKRIQKRAQNLIKEYEPLKAEQLVNLKIINRDMAYENPKDKDFSKPYRLNPTALDAVKALSKEKINDSYIVEISLTISKYPVHVVRRRQADSDSTVDFMKVFSDDYDDEVDVKTTDDYYDAYKIFRNIHIRKKRNVSKPDDTPLERLLEHIKPKELKRFTKQEVKDFDVRKKSLNIEKMYKESKYLRSSRNVPIQVRRCNRCGMTRPKIEGLDSGPIF